MMNFVDEKKKKNNNGVRLLPPGFRFQPTEEELLFQYLKCKVFSFQLPASIIPDINVCNYDPWDLPGNNNCDEEEERYLFSSKEVKYRNGNRMKRTTKSGYWKATGSDKRIVSTSSSCNNNNIVGIRKSLVFYHGKSPSTASRTHWIMHEYRLVTTPSNSSSQKYVEDLGDWVLCRIFMKNNKRSIESHHHHHHMVKKFNNNVVMMKNNNNNNNHVVEVANNKPILFFDFMRVHNSSPISSSNPIIHFPSKSSSSSSCSSSSFITEVSSPDNNHEGKSDYYV
ncbi:hypothetical protein PIB30_035137 [Stylosanthes scabra]|uniref:NAC domain-containing protein n=1 Tax=Stylosanthes scabra TaxID=79078 RepID=A0ABU6UBQ6_9FABA|nr:hypothetical protein [Stylosanthes scabra]